MAGEAAEFLLSLTDSVTPNAIKIAESIEKLSSSQIKAISTSVKLDAQMAKAQSLRAKAAVDMAKAAEAAKKSGDSSATAAEAVKGLGGDLAGMAGQATAAGGPVGMLQGFLGKLGPYGQAAAVGIGVLTIAITATVGALIAMGSAAIQVVQGLSLMTSRFAAFAGSAAKGQAITAMVQRLGQQLPFATEQIAEWTASLQRAGLAGKDLEAATKAVAAAAALNPSGGAQAAQELLSKLASGGKEATDLVKAIAEGGKKGMGPLRELGLSVEDLGGKAAVAKMSADELSKAIEKALVKKGAGPLGEMAATWPNIIAKAREGLLSLFDKLGPSVKPFMAAVKQLFGEFSKGGSVINTLKPIVTSVMSTLFAWATRAVTAIRGVLDAFLKSGKAGGVFSGVIAVLKGGWAALSTVFRVVAAQLAPIIALLKAIFSNALVLNGLKTIFTVIAAVVVGVIVAFSAFLGLVASIAGIVAGAVAALWGLAIGGLGAAEDFVAGLVDGIMGGAGSVIDAVKNLANGALEAFKGIFGIHSPSRVMLEHGETNIAGATATGIDRGADKVDDAMARLGEGGPGGGSKGGSGGGSGNTYHFHYTGPAAESDDFFARCAKFLEQVAGEQPTPEPAT